jgi:hypothetical protein
LAPGAEYPRHYFGTFAFLHGPDCALAQHFQGRVIQLAHAVFSHLTTKSRVKENVLQLMSCLTVCQLGVFICGPLRRREATMNGERVRA